MQIEEITKGENPTCEECGARNVYWVGLCLFCFIDTHLDTSLITSLESEIGERVD